MRDRSFAPKTFSFLLITIGLYLLLWQAVAARVSLPDYYYARLIELLGIGLFIALALHTPMRFEEMGIVTDRATLFRSLALGGGAALLAFFVLALFRPTDAPFFAWNLQGNTARMTYFLVAPLQEVLAKSVMYYSFELCFGKEHPWRTVGLSALTFGIFHVVYGTRMMLLSMALTVLTGWMFRRVRCVWGCALTHFAFGFLPGCFGLA